MIAQWGFLAYQTKTRGKENRRLTDNHLTIQHILCMFFRFPKDNSLFIYTSYPQSETCQIKTIDTVFLVTVNQEITGESEALDGASAAPGTFFSFKDAKCTEDPDSETSPMSKVSGRLSEDSTV